MEGRQKSTLQYSYDNRQTMTDRILFIAHHLSVAGTETFMLNATRALKSECGIQADFLIFSEEEGPNVEKARSLGCRIFRLPPRKTGVFRYLRELKGFFREHAGEYDAVHFCAGNLSTIAPIHYARKGGIPVVVCHAHNSQAAGFHNKFLHRLMRLFVGRKANRLLACSDEAGRFFFGRRKYEVVPNGVSLEELRFNMDERKRIRTAFSIPADAPVVGFVGRICAVKNPLKILSIFRQLQNELPGARLLMVGDGEMLETAKAEAQRLGVADAVTFTGQRLDTAACFSAMDLLLMPSLFEGLPFSIIEAQASGLPIVSTNRMGREGKMSENYKFISPEASDVVWAETVKKFLIESDTKQRTEQPEALSSSGYAIENTARRLAEIYRP